MSDYLKHLLIRTPLEAPAHWVRDRLLAVKSWRRPDLAEVYVEPARIHQALKSSFETLLQVKMDGSWENRFPESVTLQDVSSGAV
jgi:hypothetical protein